MPFDRLHQTQSHVMLRHWQCQRSDVSHHADFVLPMFIVSGQEELRRVEPIGESMPGVSRYSPMAALDYLIPLVRSFGLRAVLLFPVPSSNTLANVSSAASASATTPVGAEAAVAAAAKQADVSSSSSSTSSHASSSSLTSPSASCSSGVDPTVSDTNREHSRRRSASSTSVDTSDDDQCETQEPSGKNRHNTTTSELEENEQLIYRATSTEHNPVLELIPLLRRHLTELLVICDVCLCAYTANGHCAVFYNVPTLQSTNNISKQQQTSHRESLERRASCDQLIEADDDDSDDDNAKGIKEEEESLESLSSHENKHRHASKSSNTIDSEQLAIDGPASRTMIAQLALTYARYGAHVVAPSCMMDGHVRSIRHTLDEHRYAHVSILAYAVKFASCLYGPFRTAANSAPAFGDRKSYQLPPGSKALAMRAVARDLLHGADIVMVKPASWYLDIVREISVRHTDVPVAVYHVSGEYSMLKLAARANLLDLRTAMQEQVAAFRRAGATIIITYFTPDILMGEL